MLSGIAVTLFGHVVASCRKYLENHTAYSIRAYFNAGRAPLEVVVSGYCLLAICHGLAILGLSPDRNLSMSELVLFGARLLKVRGRDAC
jgi:hypothetical protein